MRKEFAIGFLIAPLLMLLLVLFVILWPSLSDGWERVS